MITMGLDISATSTGAVVLDSSNPGNVITLNVTPKTKGWERSIQHHDAISALLNTTEPCCAFIEDYAHGARGRTTLLVEIGTLYRFALHEAGIPFTTINPKSLKKYVTNDGNAGKASMAGHVSARWKFINTCEDIVDAYALAKVGQYALRRHYAETLLLSKREKEVLDLIDIPGALG